MFHCKKNIKLLFYKQNKFSLEQQFSLILEKGGGRKGLNITLSCKINCYFRAFLPFLLCAPSINLLFSHISLPNFLPFPERNHRIPGDSRKGGDGLIAIPGRSAGRLFLTAPLLSSRHYNPPAYNFPARGQADVKVAAFFGRRRPRERAMAPRRMRNGSSDECKGGILMEGF